MLVKSTPGVDFTNMFTCSFYTRRSQRHKMMDELTFIFALLGSACLKAAHKMLMKLTPNVGPVDGKEDDHEKSRPTCLIKRKWNTPNFSKILVSKQSSANLQLCLKISTY